jgi:hypothetical protein
VVAEEVQRLAERSADATRQIAALVRTIQTDTQDAVAAMERSTQGVVEGARLSDAAGTALGDIDRVSRQLSELIEQISGPRPRGGRLGQRGGGNIQHIFAVTEQTGEGTRSTAQMVRELSRTAEELRQSVARFKIADAPRRPRTRHPSSHPRAWTDPSQPARRRPQRPGLGARGIAPLAGVRAQGAAPLPEGGRGVGTPTSTPSTPPCCAGAQHSCTRAWARSSSPRPPCSA